MWRAVRWIVVSMALGLLVWFALRTDRKRTSVSWLAALAHPDVAPCPVSVATFDPGRAFAEIDSAVPPDFELVAFEASGVRRDGTLDASDPFVSVRYQFDTSRGSIELRVARSVVWSSRYVREAEPMLRRPHVCQMKTLTWQYFPDEAKAVTVRRTAFGYDMVFDGNGGWENAVTARFDDDCWLTEIERSYRGYAIEGPLDELRTCSGETFLLESSIAWYYPPRWLPRIWQASESRSYFAPIPPRRRYVELRGALRVQNAALLLQARRILVESESAAEPLGECDRPSAANTHAPERGYAVPQPAGHLMWQ